jgi:hypothetical protein
MANETIKITPDDIDGIVKEYTTGRSKAANITVELSGVNEMDTLLLLRIMEKKPPEVDDIAQAAEIMLDGQAITFTNGSEVIYSVRYNRGGGNKLHLMFTDRAYLYDMLQQTVYALMLKKLTPHLESSN